MSGLLLSCDKVHTLDTEIENSAALIHDENSQLENSNFAEDHIVEEDRASSLLIEKDSLKYFNLFDPNFNLIRSRLAFPTNWKQHDTGKYSFTGPNGIKIYPEYIDIFEFSNDHQTNLRNQQLGLPVRYPMTFDEIIEAVFMEDARRMNLELVKKYPIPQLSAWESRFDAQKFRGLPANTSFESYGIEWKGPNGLSYLTILHHFVSLDNYGGYWGFRRSNLEAENHIFDQAKKDFIAGLINQQINPKWLQAYNQFHYKKALESYAGHQKELALIKSAGQKSTALHNERMAAMDRNMKKWKNNQKSNDDMHNKTIRTIHETSVVSNPNSKVSYNVDAGANQYWINQEGEYIMSNNALYNPNLEAGTNNQTWVEYQE